MRSSCTTSCLALAFAYAAEPWSLLSRLGKHRPMTGVCMHFLFFLSWRICFLVTVMSWCQRYTLLGLTGKLAIAAVECGGCYKSGRLSSLIAFVLISLPLYSFWMWLAWAYFAFPISKVWLSSPSTLVENSFFVGPPWALEGLRPPFFLFLGLVSDIGLVGLVFLSAWQRWGGIPQSKPVRLTIDKAHLLIFNVEATGSSASAPRRWQ